MFSTATFLWPCVGGLALANVHLLEAMRRPHLEKFLWVAGATGVRNPLPYPPPSGFASKGRGWDATAAQKTVPPAGSAEGGTLRRGSSTVHRFGGPATGTNLPSACHLPQPSPPPR